jgi:hypothetical protein
MTDLEQFVYSRCKSTLVEDMLRDAVEHGAIVLAGAGEFIRIVVEAGCWREILGTTSYPHMFALHVLRAIPREHPLSSPAWELLKQWTGVSDDIITGQVYLDRVALSDVLFGPYWRALLGPEKDELIPLYQAMLRNKPSFASNILPGIAPYDLALPSLE